MKQWTIEGVYNPNRKRASNGWSSKNITDLKGKIAVVTGGTSGIGYAITKVLAKKGATVILTARTKEKGEQAKKQILNSIRFGDIRVMELDLESLKSIEKFSMLFYKSFSKLDMLFNNAGIMGCEYEITEDGFERQFAANYLGHYALTGRLLRALIDADNSRVINMSSIRHNQGEMDFANLMYQDGRGYTPMGAYSRSKLAMLLFTYEMESLIEDAGLDIRVLAAHPGLVKTKIRRYTNDTIWHKLFGVVSTEKHSIYKAALPALRAACDPTAMGGTYYGPDGPFELTGRPVIVRSNKNSHNKQDAKKLWSVSQALTEIKYDFSE